MILKGLIKGAPGVGKTKTFLAKEISYHWNTHRKSFKFVCYHYPAVQQMSFIGDFFRLSCTRDKDVTEVTFAGKNYFIKNNGADLDLLFDENDEYSQELLKDNLIADILKQEVLPHCDLIVSSRPNCLLSLQEKAMVWVDMLGFTDAEREHYIKESMKGQILKIDKFTRYLQNHSAISCLCFVPLNMVVLIYLYEHGFCLPQTSAKLYNYFIWCSICCHNNITKVTHLHKPYKNIIQQLSKLSLVALNVKRLMFAFDEIEAACPDIIDTPEAINGFGILQAVQHFALTGKITAIIHFFEAADTDITASNVDCVTVFLTSSFNKKLDWLSLNRCYIQDHGLHILQGELLHGIDNLNLWFNCSTIHITLKSKIKKLGITGNQTIEENEQFYPLLSIPFTVVERLLIYDTKFSTSGAIALFTTFDEIEAACPDVIATSEANNGLSLLQALEHFGLTRKTTTINFFKAANTDICKIHILQGELLHGIDNLNLWSNSLTTQVSDITLKWQVEKLQITGNQTIEESEQFFSLLSIPFAVVERLLIYDTKFSTSGAIALFTTFDEIEAACPDVIATSEAINGLSLLQALEHFGLTRKAATINFFKAANTDICKIHILQGELLHGIDNLNLWFNCSTIHITLESKIKKLGITGNQTIEENEQFYPLLSIPFTVVERLLIYDTKFSTSGAIALFTALKINNKLKKLNVAKSFTSLVLIKHRGHCDFKQFTVTAEFVDRGYINKLVSVITSDTLPRPLKLGSDHLLQKVLTSKVTKEILAPLEISDESQVILIEGAPGIGKTWLVKEREISHCWDTHPILQIFEVFQLVCLRDPVVQQISYINESNLFRLFCRRDKGADKVTYACLKYLFSKDFFDGFDEYPEKLQKDNLINGILKELPCCGLIVLSQPNISASLQKQAVVEVKVMGFTEADREQYIKESMKGELQKINELSQYLQDHPTMGHLCYVPLNVSIYLYLAKHGLFYNVFKYTDLPCTNVIQQLSTLNDDKLIFDIDEIKAICPDITTFPGVIDGFGLLQVVEDYIVDYQSEMTTITYLHCSLQEYLVASYITNFLARYIANLPSGKELKITEELRSDIYLHMFSVYLSLGKSSIVTNHLQCPFLYRGFYKVGSVDICKIAEALRMYSTKLSTRGTNALCTVLKNNTLQVLNIGHNAIDCDAIIAVLEGNNCLIKPYGNHNPLTGEAEANKMNAMKVNSTLALLFFPNLPEECYFFKILYFTRRHTLYMLYVCDQNSSKLINKFPLLKYIFAHDAL